MPDTERAFRAENASLEAIEQERDREIEREIPDYLRGKVGEPTKLPPNTLAKVQVVARDYVRVRIKYHGNVKELSRLRAEVDALKSERTLLRHALSGWCGRLVGWLLRLPPGGTRRPPA